MPRKPGAKAPTCSRHKAKGVGVVYLSGESFYLGPWPESEKDPPPVVLQAYEKAVSEWWARGKKPRSGAVAAGGSHAVRAMAGLTIAEVMVKYLDHAAVYYRDGDGNPTSEVENVKYALRPLRDLFPLIEAVAFGPAEVRVLQEHLIRAGTCRTLINQRIGIVKRMIKWAVTEGHVGPEVLGRLLVLPGLKKGRTKAREAEDVVPVPVADVEATLPFLSWPVRHLVQVHLASGCRTGEALRMRPCDVDRTGPVWVYRPRKHKTAHRGGSRTVFLGPKAQAALLPTWPAVCPLCGTVGRRGLIAWREERGVCGPCSDRVEEEGIAGPFAALPLPAEWVKRPLFQPADAVAEKNRLQRLARKTKVQPSQLDRSKKGVKPLRESYDRLSYNQAISRAAKKAGVEKWVPGQLRHTAATLIRARHGLEATRTILGHSKVETSQIYAERDLVAAARIAAEMG